VPYVLGLILLGLAVVAASVLMSFLVRHRDRYPKPAEPRHRLKRDADAVLHPRSAREPRHRLKRDGDAPLHPRSPTERWLFPDE
jgi:hypothetical protein